MYTPCCASVPPGAADAQARPRRRRRVLAAGPPPAGDPPSDARPPRLARAPRPPPQNRAKRWKKNMTTTPATISSPMKMNEMEFKMTSNMRTYVCKPT